MRPFCKKTHVHKIPRFRGGGGYFGFGGGGGGVPILFLWARGFFWFQAWAIFHFLSHFSGFLLRACLAFCKWPLQSQAWGPPHPKDPALLKILRVVNLLRVVFLVRRGDLLSRRTLCGHHFPGNYRHFSPQRRVHGVLNLGGRSKNTTEPPTVLFWSLRKMVSLCESEFTTESQFTTAGSFGNASWQKIDSPLSRGNFWLAVTLTRIVSWKCLPNCLSPTREGIFPLSKLPPRWG